MLGHNVVPSFFLEDCMVRYAHQFPFSPHTHDQGVGEIPPGRPLTWASSIPLSLVYPGSMS
jgi:hypothetical protein